MTTPVTSLVTTRDEPLLRLRHDEAKLEGLKTHRLKTRRCQVLVWEGGGRGGQGRKWKEIGGEKELPMRTIVKDVTNEKHGMKTIIIEIRKNYTS